MSSLSSLQDPSLPCHLRPHWGTPASCVIHPQWGTPASCVTCVITAGPQPPMLSTPSFLGNKAWAAAFELVLNFLFL